jgi:cytidylate kinase
MAVITVSNETGCGRDICTALEKQLKYRLIDKNLVRYAATIGGIDPVKAEQLDEPSYSRLKTLLTEYFDISLFSPSDMLTADSKEVKRTQDYRPYEYAASSSGENFQQATQRVITMLANEGNVLIVGRGGNFILGDRADAIHIRIVAPLEMRIQNVMGGMEFSQTEAQKHITAVDKSKASYINNYFDADIADPINYSLVLNQAMIEPERAAKAIAALI